MIQVRETHPDKVRVGDVVWCGGWRTVAEIIPASHRGTRTCFVFEDMVNHPAAPFCNVLAEDVMLVRV